MNPILLLVLSPILLAFVVLFVYFTPVKIVRRTSLVIGCVVGLGMSIALLWLGANPFVSGGLAAFVSAPLICYGMGYDW